jgi:hypothetical protein
MFKLFYGFSTWVICYPDGDLASAHASPEEADSFLTGWTQGI